MDLKGDKNSEWKKMMHKALAGGGNLGLPPGFEQEAAQSQGGPVYIKSRTAPTREEGEDVREVAQPKAPVANDDLDSDEDPELAEIRARRMNELKKETTQTKVQNALGHGSYVEITQDEFLNTVTKSKYSLVHFFHKEFERCKIIDKHLVGLARIHTGCRMAKLEGAKAPFFVTKLNVRMLPTVVFFKDGVAIDRLVGFDELGGKDDFTTEMLERRIRKSGIFSKDNRHVGDDDDDEEEERRDVKDKGTRTIRTAVPQVGARPKTLLGAGDI